MALLQTNATVSVQRRTYNPVTKQSSAAATVSGLSAVPVYIDEIGHRLRAAGMAAEFALQMLWDARYDIRDGDVIVGYNAASSAHPPLLQVQHAESSGLGTPLACRVCMLSGEARPS